MASFAKILRYKEAEVSANVIAVSRIVLFFAVNKRGNGCRDSLVSVTPVEDNWRNQAISLRTGS
jgi:hypothetical protein